MLYPPRAYQTGPDPGNFWQSTVPALPDTPSLESYHTTEVAIIGGGYTGLSAAIRLAELGIEATILDAAQPGWGASGRNGGFACLGGTKLSDGQLLRRFGEEHTRKFYRAQAEGIATVAENLTRYQIEADACGSGEYIFAHRPKDFAGFGTEAEAMRRLRGLAPEILPPETCAERGLNSPALHGALHIPVGFGINPLKYALGLFSQAQALGVRYFSRSPVLEIAANNRLRCALGEVRARHIVIATNGYTTEAPHSALTGWEMPVLSNILVTRPLTEPELADQGWSAVELAADTRMLLHYFRLLPDRRLLFGMRGGTGLSLAEAARTRRKTRVDFESLFPAWKQVETEYFWSGLACLSRSRLPFVGQLSDGLWAALGYHGSGLALASWSGRRLAEIIAGHASLEALPAPMRKRPRPFPLPALRRQYLKAAYAWHGWRDRGAP